MKDIRIDNRLHRVFVLTESDERTVYIPVKHLHRIDYERLKEIEIKYKKNMLEGLSKTTLDNGRNALVQYDGIIQVMQKDQSARIRKPDEGMFDEVLTKADDAKAAEVKSEVKADVVVTAQEAPVRRRPGPKPKPKPADGE